MSAEDRLTKAQRLADFLCKLHQIASYSDEFIAFVLQAESNPDDAYIARLEKCCRDMCDVLQQRAAQANQPIPQQVQPEPPVQSKFLIN